MFAVQLYHWNVQTLTRIANKSFRYGRKRIYTSLSLVNTIFRARTHIHTFNTDSRASKDAIVLTMFFFPRNQLVTYVYIELNRIERGGFFGLFTQ